MNDDGKAVGRAYSVGDTGRAIYYDGTVLHDLNDFLPDDFEGELVDAQQDLTVCDIAGSASPEFALAQIAAIDHEIDHLRRRC